MYKLRWYINYLFRPDYYGVWNCADPKRPAWCHNYEGINKVFIQGKDLEGNIKVLAECDGQDFMNLSWIAEARINLNRNKLLNNTQLPSRIVGLMMATRKGQISVYIDGTVNFDDIVLDKINFATFGR